MRVALVNHNLNRGGGQGRVNYELVLHLLRTGDHVTRVAEPVSTGLLDAGVVWHCPTWPTSATSSDTPTPRSDPSVPGPISSSPTAIPSARPTTSTSPTSFTRRGFNLPSTSHASAAALTRGTTAVSQKVRDELISLGFPNHRISVIVNGVDPAEFRPGPQARAPLGLPENTPLALFVGDIRTPRKNLDTVLRALQVLPEVHLAVVGNASSEAVI